MLLVRIDLTRMECKAPVPLGDFLSGLGIDLTRMECKGNFLFAGSWG